MQELLPLSPAVARAVLLVLGVALLAAGRRLFWLAVAALGFLAGLWLIEGWATELPRGTALVVALAAGLVGLLLALLVQKAAVVLGGFLLGVVVFARLLPALGVDAGRWQGVLIAAGGLLVAVLALALFGVALTLLTAGAGASLVVESVGPPVGLAPLLLVALWAVGALVQLRQLRGGKMTSRRS
jgi:hypothetical protein